MFDLTSYFSFVDQPLSLFHPLAIGAYIYCAICLGGAFASYKARQVLAEKVMLLEAELPEIEQQLDEANEQLRSLNYQMTHGIDLLKDLTIVLRGIVLGLVESKALSILLALLSSRPFWMRFMAKKGIQVAFNKVK